MFTWDVTEMNMLDMELSYIFSSTGSPRLVNSLFKGTSFASFHLFLWSKDVPTVAGLQRTHFRFQTACTTCKETSRSAHYHRTLIVIFYEFLWNILHFKTKQYERLFRNLWCEADKVNSASLVRLWKPNDKSQRVQPWQWLPQRIRLSNGLLQMEITWAVAATIVHSSYHTLYV